MPTNTLHLRPGFWVDPAPPFVGIPTLSIIIASRNDPLLSATCRNLAETAADCELIVVDDASDAPLAPELADIRCQVIRNETRLGCGASRTIGARASCGDWLLFTDGHMVFPDGWLDVARAHLLGAPESSAFCSTYLSLTPERTSLLNPCAIIGGADAYFWRPEFGGMDLMGVTPRWPMESDGPYAVPSMIGAAFIFHRDWFFRLRGFDGLKYWAIDELFMSLKTWLAGGRVAVMPDVFVGHYDSQAGLPRRRSMKSAELLYNKLFMLSVILHQREFSHLLSRIDHLPVTHQARGQMEADSSLAELRREIRGHFIRDVDWLCAEFRMSHPRDL